MLILFTLNRVLKPASISSVIKTTECWVQFHFYVFTWIRSRNDEYIMSCTLNNIFKKHVTKMKIITPLKNVITKNTNKTTLNKQRVKNITNILSSVMTNIRTDKSRRENFNLFTDMKIFLQILYIKVNSAQSQLRNNSRKITQRKISKFSYVTVLTFNA